MGDRDRIQRSEYELTRVAQQIAGLPVRRGEGGGQVEDRRLIGGFAVGAVADTDATLMIDGVAALSGGLDPSDGNPAAQVRVENTFGQVYADNEYLQAAFSEGVVASPATDWQAITKSVDQDPPLRAFELTATKQRTNATATAKFLDHAGAMVGSNVTLHDPILRFSGKAANYAGTINGMRGFALLRSDLAEVEQPRWDIVAMDGIAQWVMLEYAGSPDNEWQLDTDAFGGTQWEYKRPVANGDTLTITDPLDLFPSPEDGDLAYAELTNPDTTPPTYAIRAKKGIGPSAAVKTFNMTGTITAGSAATPVGPETATVYEVAAGGVASSIGTKDLYNPLPHEVTGDGTCVQIDGDDYLIVSAPQPLECTTINPVTSVACVDDEIEYTTTPYEVVIGPCP
jgi:hypothetical protein